MRGKGAADSGPPGPRKAGRASARTRIWPTAKALAQGGIYSRPSMELKGAPAGRKPCGAGKKKMRSLGTVQMPTEAFMAVLKLDDEG